MKRYFIKGFVFAAVAFTTVPAMAQKEKNEKGEKTDKDVQTIVITRKGDVAEKTVVEINGDKVLINGKESSKDDDVTVNVHKIKTGDHGLTFYNNGKAGQTWNWDNDRVSLFQEDANRAMLGVETDSDEDGATVLKVTEESAAQKMGLKKGDVIIKVDDKKINEENSITEVIRSKKPGDKVTVTFLRDGKEQKMTTELGKWKGINMATLAPTRVFGNSLPRTPMAMTPGATFRYSGTPRLGLSIQDTDEGKGVKVIDVDDEGNAAKAGIKEDDVITHVNDKEVNSADEVSKLMKENKDKVSVRMQVQRAGKAQTIEVRVPRKLKTADL